MFSDTNSYLAKVVCGGLAGATAVTVTHPMDLIRIRLQTQPELKGWGGAIKQVMSANGPVRPSRRVAFGVRGSTGRGWAGGSCLLLLLHCCSCCCCVSGGSAA